jgi:hypothetical protein
MPTPAEPGVNNLPPSAGRTTHQNPRRAGYGLRRDALSPTVLGLLIDVDALVSVVARTLACITAAARVLLMAHDGLAHG